MKHTLAVAMSFSMIAGAPSLSPVHAQPLSSRTWVSGVGNDGNTCARTAPCATFAVAITKTAAGGEIDALDAGPFGTVTIDKSITIDGNGVVAGITACSACTGVYVNAGNNDVVILRNLAINALGTGGEGIYFGNGRQLIIEDTRIVGFVDAGVYVPPMTSNALGSVVIRNSTIANNSDGIRVRWGNTSVIHSVISGNTFRGLIAYDDGVINAESNLLTGNAVAIRVGRVSDGSPPQPAGTIRISDNAVYGNQAGFVCDGGVLASNGTNRKGSNTGGGVAVCSPNATISQQ